MIIKKLTKMPYAQAHVEITDNSTNLFSYVTLVASIDEDGWLEIYGLYSMTTRRHISAFLSEYCPSISYSSAKKIYEDGYRINIFTGEIIEINMEINP